MRLLLALALGVATPAAAQSPTAGPLDEAADGTLLHKPSGFVFPAQLGDMPRRKTQVYAPDDIGVEYTLGGGANGDPWLTLYVYPARGSVEEEASGIEASIIQNLEARPLEQQPALSVSVQGGASRWFSGSHNGIGLTSGYVLARRGGWSIKVRGSSPAAAGEAGMDRLLEAIARVAWSWTPPASTSAETT